MSSTVLEREDEGWSHSIDHGGERQGEGLQVFLGSGQLNRGEEKKSDVAGSKISAQGNSSLFINVLRVFYTEHRVISLSPDF